MFASFAMAIRAPLHDNVVNVGDAAPEFSVVADTGERLSARNFNGKALLLNFWASWCEPCIAETPSLNALARELRAQGLIVLGVSADEDPEAYSRFVRKERIGFFTFRQPEKSIQYDYGTIKTPETYLIDRHGKVRAKFISNQNWTSAELVAQVKSVLSEAPD
jgi:cytochrome c biogenesis protein CcmG, thiol:disulfide interchange protein DsbE